MLAKFNSSTPSWSSSVSSCKGVLSKISTNPCGIMLQIDHLYSRKYHCLAAEHFHQLLEVLDCFHVNAGSHIYTRLFSCFKSITGDDGHGVSSLTFLTEYVSKTSTDTLGNRRHY